MSSESPPKMSAKQMKFLNSAAAEKKYSILPAIMMTPKTQNLLASSISSRESNENDEEMSLLR